MTENKKKPTEEERERARRFGELRRKRREEVASAELASSVASELELLQLEREKQLSEDSD